MTIVLGVAFLAGSEVVVIADTRVSYSSNARPPRDGIKKLYKISDTAILGFSGRIDAAQVVIAHLSQKLSNYRRRLVIAHLQDDLRRWIQEVTARLEPGERSGLSFLLCAIEPSRRPLANKGLVSVPEWHIYTYSVAKDSGVVQASSRKMVGAIGASREFRAMAVKRARELEGFMRKHPEMRAQVVGILISQLFQDAGSQSVGGPFQIIRITPDGLQCSFSWSRLEEGQIDIEEDDEKTILCNRMTGETYTLVPIWTFRE